MPVDVEIALKQINAKLRQYRKYDAYYEGNHDVRFSGEKFRRAFEGIFREISDNLCPAVVDTLADRLQPVGVSHENKEVSKRVWDIWERNRMDERAGFIHQEAVKQGDAYAIVWPEGNEARIHPNLAIQTTVHYSEDDGDNIDWAAKVWQLESDHYRLNMYYADRIEKWITTSPMKDRLPDKASSFREHEAPVQNTFNRVPVFHFANNRGIVPWGRSELKQIIPLQDALNKSFMDLIVAGEFQALPQRWATGLEIPTDPLTGKKVNPFEPGGLWATATDTVKFGQFEPANLTQILSTQNDLRLEIARVSGTPPHYLMLNSGQFPSGEALRVAEVRLIRKVEDRQKSFGNVWEDILTFCSTIEGISSEGISVEWEDAAPVSEKEQAETAILKQEAGISQRQALREMGYDDDEIGEMLIEGELKAEQAAERQAQMFDRGLVDLSA